MPLLVKEYFVTSPRGTPSCGCESGPSLYSSAARDGTAATIPKKQETRSQPIRGCMTVDGVDSPAAVNRNDSDRFIHGLTDSFAKRGTRDAWHAAIQAAISLPRRHSGARHQQPVAIHKAEPPRRLVRSTREESDALPPKSRARNPPYAAIGHSIVRRAGHRSERSGLENTPHAIQSGSNESCRRRWSPPDTRYSDRIVLQFSRLRWRVPRRDNLWSRSPGSPGIPIGPQSWRLPVRPLAAGQRRSVRTTPPFRVQAVAAIQSGSSSRR